MALRLLMKVWHVSCVPGSSSFTSWTLCFCLDISVRIAGRILPSPNNGVMGQPQKYLLKLEFYFIEICQQISHELGMTLYKCDKLYWIWRTKQFTSLTFRWTRIINVSRYFFMVLPIFHNNHGYIFFCLDNYVKTACSRRVFGQSPMWR